MVPHNDKTFSIFVEGSSIDPSIICGKNDEIYNMQVNHWENSLKNIRIRQSLLVLESILKRYTWRVGLINLLN